MLSKNEIAQLSAKKLSKALASREITRIDYLLEKNRRDRVERIAAQKSKTTGGP